MRSLISSCLAVLVSAPALAQGGLEPSGGTEIVVRYSGPADCSSAEQFIERTAPRLPSIRLLEHGREVGLDVILERGESGVSAELVIHLESGGTLSRSILASSCDEATEAIAFVAAVALDPGAREPVLVKPASGGVAPDQTSAADPARASTEEQDGEQVGVDEGPRPDRGQGEEGSVGLLGVGAALGFGVAPSPMLGPDVSLRWSSGRPGAWSPALVLGAQYLLSEGHQAPAGVASFHQGLARVEFCPSHLQAGIFSLRPCLGLGGGWVQSEGSDTAEAARATRPYFDARLGVQLALALGRQSAIVLSGYAGLPWIRDSYQFDMTVFHQTSVVTAGLGLSIGARLW